jgi:hypothetical protein
MADLLRVSIIGAMPGGEEWSVNPVYSIGGDFGTPVSATQAQTIATAIAAIAVPTGILAQVASSTTFQGCRVEARSLAGVLESQAEGIKAVATPGSGGSGKPFQTSAVSSLRTARAGASGRGRLYWPVTGISLATATLRPTSADMTSLTSGVKTYLSAIQTAIDVTLDGVSLAVWSRKLLDLFPVTSIQMGDVLDVQRRRRDQLIESYTTLAYP